MKYTQWRAWSSAYTIGISLLIAFGLSGCSLVEPGATPTPVPTATPEATATPLPTATLVATATPLPTATPVSTPTPAGTSYSSSDLGFTATLPGKGWTMSVMPGNGSRGELWLTPDKRLLFSPNIVTNALPKSTLQLEAYVKGFAEAAFSPPIDITPVDFHNYPSYRVSALWSLPDLPGDYRFIGHFFIAHGRFYFIFAASRIEDWDKGGKEKVQAILDSVGIGSSR